MKRKLSHNYSIFLFLSDLELEKGKCQELLYRMLYKYCKEKSLGCDAGDKSFQIQTDFKFHEDWKIKTDRKKSQETKM